MGEQSCSYNPAQSDHTSRIPSRQGRSPGGAPRPRAARGGGGSPPRRRRGSPRTGAGGGPRTPSPSAARRPSSSRSPPPPPSSPPAAAAAAPPTTAWRSRRSGPRHRRRGRRRRRWWSASPPPSRSRSASPPRRRDRRRRARRLGFWGVETEEGMGEEKGRGKILGWEGRLRCRPPNQSPGAAYTARFGLKYLDLINATFKYTNLLLLLNEVSRKFQSDFMKFHEISVSFSLNLLLQSETRETLLPM